MLASTTTTREKEEGGVRKGEDEKVRKGGGEKLLDKDWGARIPDYISRSLLSLLVFIMGLTMKVFFFTLFFDTLKSHFTRADSCAPSSSL